MNLNQKIQSYLNEHKNTKKRLSATALLSLLIALAVVSSLIMPAISMTISSAVNMWSLSSSSDEAAAMILGADVQIPSNAIDFTDRLTSLKITVGDVTGTEVDAGNADMVDAELSITYQFSNTDGLYYNSATDKQNCIYLQIPKDQIEIIEDQLDEISADNTEDWKKYCQLHPEISNTTPATFDVIKAEDGSDYGYLVMTLNDAYLQYVIDRGNFEGQLQFDGRINRDGTQSGDKTVSLGDQFVTITFDDIEPTVGKTGSLKWTDYSQLPVAHWSITVSNIYELNQYLITDTNFSNMVDGSFTASPENVFSIIDGNPEFDADGNLVWLANENSSGTITIEYDAPISEEALKNNLVENTVTITKDGESESTGSTGSITPNVNIKASISKTGKPSYEVQDERGYIYWTVTVQRPYGLSLDGYTVSDSAFSSGTLVSVVDGGGNDISGKVTQNGSDFVFADDSGVSNAVITYKTPVAANTSTDVTNNASVTPPGSTTPEDSKSPTITYNDTNLYSINKYGSFVEDASTDSTTYNDYVEWTVTLDATINQSSYETLKGYVITDDAFTQTGFEFVGVEAYNNNNRLTNIGIENISSILTGSGSTYTVSSDVEVDKLTLKYRVPLTSEQQADRNELTGTNTMGVYNEVSAASPEGDKESTDTTVNVPGVAGSMTINANKSWNGASDKNRPTSVQLKLQYKVGENGTWADYKADGITNPATVNNGTTYSWTSLPKRDPNDRTKLYYYRVVEVNVPTDYTASDGSNNETGTNQDGATVTVTNTWNKMNIGTVKNWYNIPDGDKPDTITLRLLQSTDQTTWIQAAGQSDIVLNKSNGYVTDGWTGLPKKDSNGNELYYKVVEVEASLFDDSGAYIGTDSDYEFTVSTSHESIKASDYNYDIDVILSNTWKNMNVTVEKSWSGDAGYEASRPDVTLVLWKKVGNGEWTATDQTITLKNDGSGNMIADGSTENGKYTWHSLPKTENGETVYYRVEEKSVTGYTPNYSNNYGISSTGALYVENVYNNIDISANKVWAGEASSDSRPDTVTLRLLKSTNQYSTTESDWTKAADDIVMTKNADGTYDIEKAVWPNQPKTEVIDGVETTVYYKVVEVDTAEDYDVSYQYTYGVNNTTEMQVTNTWNRCNITAQKTWSNDTGQEAMRPSITLTLWKKVGNGEWESTGQSVTMNNDGTGAFYVDGSTTANSYTWEALPKTENGETVVYKVVEDYVRGYTASYSNSSGMNSNGTITVTNTSNFINVYANKSWDGDTGSESGRPSEILFTLMQSTTPDVDSSWKEAEVSGTDTVTKTLTKKDDNTYNNVNWTRLPSKDENGNTIYYKVVESYPEGVSADEYTVSYSSPVSTSSTFYVKNTWNKMNLSVNKAWNGVKDEYIPESLTFKLQYKVGENGVWADADATTYPNVTVEAANNWTLSNAWMNLPRTQTGTDGIVQNIYYRACEIVPDDAKFYPQMDEGTNTTGTSTVTNVANTIDVTVQKEWKNVQYESRTDITVHLMMSTNAGATWTEVDTVGQQTLTLSGDTNSSYTWTDLPTKDGDLNIIYKIVEDDVDGFTASYSPATISSTGTITVTNTEIPPYEKNATVVVANKLNLPEDKEVLEQDRTYITQITPADLKNWKTATVSIDGVDTECYIFKWTIDFKTPTTGTEVYTDTLPLNSVFYNSEAGYMFTYQYHGASPYEMSENDTMKSNISYDGDRTIVFKSPSGIDYITYCTAIPKSIVDNAITLNGYYDLINRIQESQENEPRDVTLSIKGTDSSNKIEKSNDTAGQDFQDSIASYSVEVNKEGKYLANGKTVDITDVFAITGYQSSGGTKQTGINLVNVNLEDITVYEIDADGKYKILSPDEYSYTTESVEGVIRDEIDYITKIQTGNFPNYGNGSYYINSNSLTASDSYFPEGLEVIAVFTGTAGNTVTVDSTYMGEGVEITAVDSVFGSDGKARVKIKFTKTFASDKNIGSYTVANTTAIAIESVTLVSETPVTQTLIHYTVPDGKHLEIRYDYKMTKPDGTALNVGDMVWMQNEASIHTSAGDESSKTSEFEFEVVESSGSMWSGNSPKIRKVDVGSYSINNLNASFVLAKFDTTVNEWVYATSFPLIADTKANHSIDYNGPLYEGDDAIPEGAGVIELTGSQFNVDFSTQSLFKLIEIKAPTGYDPTPYEQGYTSLSANADNTYYFTYDSAVTDEEKTAAGIPTDKTVTAVAALGTIEISNVRPISVGASKVWEQVPPTQELSVTVQLLQSHTKSSEIPADAVAVENAYDYLVDKEGQPTDGTYILKNVLQDGAYVCENEEIWHNLPNGKSGRALYYYVKEIAYTIGETTYTLNSSGDYVDANGNQYTDSAGVVGQYLPTYNNNAVNSDGTVEITNSREFVVKKIWMDSDGAITKNPPDVQITFTLAGITDDGTVVPIALTDEERTLSAANNWKISIPQNYVSMYSRFKVTEDLTEANYNYTISDIYALNGSIGIASLINKDRTPTKVDVVVEKKWGDTGAHKNIEVQLYSGISTVTYPQLVAMSRNAEYIAPGLSIPSITDSDGNEIETLIELGADNSWTYTWEDIPYKDEDGNTLYYYAVEQGIPDGYTASYNVLVQTSTQTITIDNSPPAGSLVLNKSWKDTEGNTLNMTEGSVEVEVRRDSVVIEDGSTGDTEETPDEPTVEIQKQNIKVMALGDSITDGYIPNAEHGYRKYFYDVITKAGHTIDMVGNKGNNWDYSNSTYTKTDGTVISYDPANEGYSSAYTSTTRWNIMDIINGNLSTSPSSANTINDNQPDVILLLIGTNDIMGAHATGLSEDEYQQRLQALVTEIFTQKSDTKLVIMSPPKIYADHSTSYFQGYQESVDQNTVNVIAAIKKVIAAEATLEHTCYYLDLYTLFKNHSDYTTLLHDYCHPNQTGYEYMGNYIAERLPEILSGGEDDLNKATTDDTTDDTTSDEESGSESDSSESTESTDTIIKTDITDEEFAALEEVGTYTITPDDNGNWNLIIEDLPADDGNGNTYVYYIKENTDLYTVEYSGNGQLISSTGSATISFTNIKEYEPISLSVTKEWADDVLPDGITQPTEVTVGLYKADKSGLAEEEWYTDDTFVKEVTLNADNEWKYTFDNLNPNYFYYIKETEMDGWTDTYTGNGTQTDEANITVTNTFDVGDLSIEKQWYGDDSGNVQDVQVEVYRVLTPKVQSIANSFSLFSAVMVLGVSDHYVSLSDEYPDVTNYFSTSYDISELCAGLAVDSIEFVFSKEASGNGQVNLNNVGTALVPSGITHTMSSSDFSQGIPESLETIQVNQWGISWDAALVDIRFYYTPASSITVTPETATLIVGESIELTASDNKNPPAVWSTSDGNVATVSDAGLVTAVGAGTAIITGKDGTADTAATDSSTITVKAFDITKGGSVLTGDINVMEGSDSIELDTVDVQAADKVTWSSDNEDAATVDEDGTVTIKQFGVANITATYTIGENNVQTDTVKVNVQSAELGLTIDKDLLHIGNTATLTPTPGDNVSYSVDPEGVVSIDPDTNTVTAIGEGEVKITAARGGRTADVTIIVAQLGLSQEELTVPLNGAAYLTATNAIGDLTWSSDNEAVATVDSDGKISGVSKGTATITVEDENGGLAYAEITVEAVAADAGVPTTAEKYGDTLTISKANGWKTSLTGLPLTDGQGGVYTYYIKEIGYEDSVYLPIFYEGNGVELSTESSSTLKVQNMITDEEAPSVEMPSTGGEGTAKFYYTGGAMVLLALIAGSNRIRRRVKARRTK